MHFSKSGDDFLCPHHERSTYEKSVISSSKIWNFENISCFEKKKNFQIFTTFMVSHLLFTLKNAKKEKLIIPISRTCLKVSLKISKKVYFFHFIFGTIFQALWLAIIKSKIWPRNVRMWKLWTLEAICDVLVIIIAQKLKKLGGLGVQMWHFGTVCCYLHYDAFAIFSKK